MNEFQQVNIAPVADGREQFISRLSLLSRKAVKKVTSIRARSLYRDAAWMREYQALIARPNPPAPAGSSVSISHSSLPSATALPHSSSSTADKSGKKRRTLWWDFHRSPPLRSHRLPPVWRDLSWTMKIEQCVRGMKERGPVLAFSLNLRDDIEAEAKKQDQPVDWIFRRVVRRLQAELKRKDLALVLVGEETDRYPRRLHIHGFMQVKDRDEAKSIRRALRQAGGPWDAVRQHQAHTKADPDSGWTGYLSKELWRTSKWMRRLENARSCPLQQGRPVRMSRAATHAGQGFYVGVRNVLIAAGARVIGAKHFQE